MDFKPFPPRRIIEIFSGIIGTPLINFNCFNGRSIATLGPKQRYHTGARAHVEQMLATIQSYPGCKQHSVGTHAHGTARWHNSKLLEVKWYCRRWHSCD